MKKLIFVGILATIAAASCTVKMEQDIAPVSEGTKVSLSVEGNLWTGDDTKTAYTAGSGVALSGTEKIGLFYYKDSKLNNASIAASPTSTPGQYSFTMPTAAEGATGWYGIMPFSKTIAYLTSTGTSGVIRLGPVQFPEANSFDPHCDYMAVKPFTVEGASGAKNGTIDGFKRLFAPLCINISGLPEGSKIYTATISLSQTFDRSNALTGLYYVWLKDAFKDTYVAYAEKTSMGNAVSAEYTSGLSAVGGTWPVWYMVNPIKLTSGCQLTVTVSTQNKTYTRTVTLPSEKTLSVDILNSIAFNITGDGSTSVDSITQDFTGQTLSSKSTSLTASNGSAYTWGSTASRAYDSSTDDAGSGLKGAMRLCKSGGESFTFPTIPGKNIVGAKIYTHPASRSYASAAVTLTVDGTDTYNLNLAAANVSECVAYKGGVIDIALPAGKTSLAGLTVASATTQVHLISAITLLVEDAAIDPNDYYAKFLAGQDITIGGKVFNISAYPKYSLVKAYEMTNANYFTYESNGIVFLDYDSADGKADTYTCPTNIKPENVVIIGRYKNHQPTLAFTGTGTTYPTKQFVAYKNIRIETGNYGISTSYTTGPLEVYMEDCTLITTNRYAFAESNATLANNFSKVIVHNCVISCPYSVIAHHSTVAGGSTMPSLQKVEFRNTVISAPAVSGYPCISFRSSSTATFPTPNAEYVVENCTFNNFSTNGYGLLSLTSAKSVKFDNNVAGVALAKASPFVLFPAVQSPAITGTVTGNRMYSSNTFSWSIENSAHVLSGSGLTLSDNLLSTEANPFKSTASLDNLYLPVDETKVTNGAGASYATKLWKTWE